ncbi:hypothetical protein KJ365_13795 [Glaciecola sp. XM2]|jgi:hypothetical protein|uniref:hypothetical protein n=1 Tax=Glaciecola sp. XM2 TaxID=1914931 RepID=UPI001BDEB059|nr:hypothetical protein [Glaciecola sp. XM2]MBT1451961.1 hypothetical protein [Glaciecola sp. XM2]
MTSFKQIKSNARRINIFSANVIITMVLYAGLLHRAHITRDPGVQELASVLLYPSSLVILLLILAILYLQRTNAHFEVKLENKMLHVSDSSSPDCTWSVNVKKIVTIDQQCDIDGKFNAIFVYLNDGSYKKLSAQYNFNRAKFYKALKKANPFVRLPKDPSVFRQVNH